MNKRELRFWARVAITANPDKCWEWQGYIGPNGYGQVCINWQRTSAHKAAFLYGGGVLARGELVRHKVCRNRKCCNPKHLLAGTYKDNHDDAVIDGTYTRGEMHGLSHLQDADIQKMFDLRKAGLSYPKLGKAFGVTHKTAERIIKRLTWKHVEII